MLLAVVGLVCSITAQYFAAKAATGFSARLRSVLCAHMQGLSLIHISIAKADHQYNATVTAPTCEAVGYTTHTCSVCGDSYVEK